MGKDCCCRCSFFNPVRLDMQDFHFCRLLFCLAFWLKCGLIASDDVGREGFHHQRQQQREKTTTTSTPKPIWLLVAAAAAAAGFVPILWVMSR
jgi:hypothetical protein